MSLSRKNRRELKRLRSQAEDLLDQQRVVLSHAGSVLQEAGRQAKVLGNEYVTPRVVEAVETVRPTVDRGVNAARRAADQVRRATAPAVTTALTKTVRALEQLENKDAAKQIEKFAVQRGLIAAPKKKSNVGGIVAISLGVVAAVGAGYALWQAFRTDDELWVSPEESSAA